MNAAQKPSSTRKKSHLYQVFNIIIFDSFFFLFISSLRLNLSQRFLIQQNRLIVSSPFFFAIVWGECGLLHPLIFDGSSHINRFNFNLQLNIRACHEERCGRKSRANIDALMYSLENGQVNNVFALANGIYSIQCISAIVRQFLLTSDYIGETKDNNPRSLIQRALSIANKEQSVSARFFNVPLISLQEKNRSTTSKSHLL